VYVSTRERGLNPLDPTLGLDWPRDIEALLSPKDEVAPTLDEAKTAGLLPDYEACRRLYATLAGSTP
jgi:dTDP-4-dehydrorhamnose 3,5-epimerase